MKVSLSSLVEQVKANMEELLPIDEMYVDKVRGVLVEDYIRLKLPDAILAVWAAEPVSALPQTDCSASLVPERRADGSGRVVLPDDVWRMAEFQMEGWRRPVTEFLDPSSPRYELQYVPYARGGAARPACVLRLGGERNVLDYYSLPPHVLNHKVVSARYVACPKRDASAFDLSPQSVQAVCYTCASLVYEILGEPEQAAAMLRCIVR